MSTAPGFTHYVFVSDKGQAELLSIAKALLGAHGRPANVTVAWQLGPGLGGHLNSKASPNLVLLVAHGRDRGFILEHDPKGGEDHVLLPLSWWEHPHDHVSVFAVGCWSSQCYRNYPLHDRVRRFLGFSQFIWFHYANPRRRQLHDVVLDLLGTLGRRFFAAAEVDRALEDAIRQDYQDAIDRVEARWDLRRGDEVTAAYLQDQLDALTLF